MRYKNKYNINLAKNPYKLNKSLLNEKNELEAQWYDEEASQYFEQFRDNRYMLEMDSEYEEWFGGFIDSPSDENLFDKNYRYLNLIPQDPQNKILELGSGNGAMTRFLQRRGLEIYSIDISFNCCRFLKQSSKNSNPVRTCAERLPFKDKSFGTVIAFLSLHHLNLDLTLKEIKRVLMDDGTGIFIEPVMGSELFYKLRQFLPIADNESPGGGGIIIDELSKISNNNNLICKIYEYEILTRFDRFNCMMRYQDNLKKVDYWILSNFPYFRKFARNIVIEIRKK